MPCAESRLIHTVNLTKSNQIFIHVDSKVYLILIVDFRGRCLYHLDFRVRNALLSVFFSTLRLRSYDTSLIPNCIEFCLPTLWRCSGRRQNVEKKRQRDAVPTRKPGWYNVYLVCVKRNKLLTGKGKRSGVC